MYIDVRGNWPILFIGMRAYELTKVRRSISAEEAIEYLREAGLL